jgi:serine phosphatase RsbU (regulator of sigma subunit)
LLLEAAWDGLLRVAGWERSLGIAGVVAILGVLAIAVTDVIAGVALALVSGALFAVVVSGHGAPTTWRFGVALVAVWVAAALTAGVMAVKLRAQAHRGVTDAVSLHRELVGLLVPAPRVQRVDVSIAAAYHPGEQRLELGGDFYAATERSDGSIALLVGDVSGHGPAAAALGAMLRSAWEGLVAAGVAAEARVRTLNQLLFEHARHEELFATLCSVEVDPSLTTATVTLAGHPAPILKHAADIVVLDIPPGIPLGVRETGTWTSTQIALPEFFSLLLFTDGIIEGRVNESSGERFGTERLIEAYAHSQAHGRELLNDILHSATRAHRGPLPDDAALLLLNREPAHEASAGTPGY